VLQFLADSIPSQFLHFREFHNKHEFIDVPYFLYIAVPAANVFTSPYLSVLHFAMAALTPRVLCWRRSLDDNSLEAAAIQPLAGGVELAGTIVAIHDNAPLEVRYRIGCDFEWRTRTVSIEQRFGLERSTLSLSVDEAGRWSDEKTGPIHSLAGSLEVDLELSPITNSLPINRLKLAIGQREEIVAAWIRFPSLEIVHARQSYERLSERTYRYRSLASGFTANIEVDDVGLTIRYEGIWERIAEA
jgi:uncharacterized protein